MINQKPKTVLVARLLGTGKTLLAQALGRELQWPVINKDRLKFSSVKMEMNDYSADYTAHELVFFIGYDMLDK